LYEILLQQFDDRFWESLGVLDPCAAMMAVENVPVKQSRE